MTEFGYTNFVGILNAKNYGIPQNRRRCFMVSIFGDYSYDLPKSFTLNHLLKDFLEDSVDEKYYLSQKAIDGLTRQMDKAHKPNLIDPKKQEGETLPTLTAGYRKQGHYKTYLKVKNKSLKEQMCKDLISSGKDKENDVIRHSYTNSRIKGEMKDIQQNNISPTLDTRCDCLGVVVKEDKNEE